MQNIQEFPKKETQKCVFIIPYFGKIPEYFGIWLKSAEANPDFSFFIYSDLPFPISENSNVRLIQTSFEELKIRIKRELGEKCVVNSPYKLCDYRPAFGFLFREDIKDFDFWGFCDLDLILGDLGKFLTAEVFENHDKLFRRGHFSIVRNTEKMNRIFLEKYPNVLDCDFTFHTKYSCHFDERGSLTFAPMFDKTVRYSFPAPIYDLREIHYSLMPKGTEGCVVWKNGGLHLFWDGGKRKDELMLIHFQKRRILNIPHEIGGEFAFFRNEIVSLQGLDPTEILSRPVDEEKKKAFFKEQKKRRRKDIFENLKNGALKFRFHKKIKKLRY